MRVLVTGGSGFTGGYVIPRLVAGGHEVVALARSAASSGRVASLGAAPVGGDLDDPVSIDTAFRASGADALVNLASLGFGHAGAIVAAAEDAGIHRAVLVSTTAIFTSLNAASKSVRVDAEETIARSGLDWTVLRPTMIYGAPGDRNMWRLLGLLRRSPVVPLPDGGNRLQQPVHVDDLAAAIVASVGCGAAVGRAYDVAGPEALTFRDVVEQSARAVGRFPRLVPVPAGPAVGALAALERTGRAGPIKAEQIERLLEDKAFDIGDARRDLGFDPRPFFAGIAEEAALGAAAPGPWEQAGRYARTVSHIPPGQLVHRVRLRATRAAVGRRPDAFERRWRRGVGGVRWPAVFTAVDAGVAVGCPSPEGNAAGVFDFIGERRDLGRPIDWRPTAAPQLWRYHLHYWEWAWPFAAHPDREWARAAFAELWRSWKAGTRFGRWDEWSPYVVSLRSWVLCNLFHPLVAGTTLESGFLDDVGLHAGFVAANLERDVGGNHLAKNLKAAVALGVFLGDDALVDVGRRGLEREIAVQVLADGGHFELSPSYHAQVLGDLVDVALLLDAAGLPPVVGADAAIRSMRQWLAAVLLPDGDVPCFGDSSPVGEGRLTALGVSPAPPPRLRVLPESGYVVVRPDDRVHAVLDVGPPCPPQLPAHAQADCLSFVLSLDGARVVVDPGSTTYEAGAQRAFERSTAAHDTVTVDATDQSEVWGRFRAGRLASPSLERAEDDGTTVTVVATHDGYDRLPGGPRHRRTWRFAPGIVTVEDAVDGSGRHLLSSRYVLRGGVAVDISAVDAPSCVVDVRTDDQAGGDRILHVRLYGDLPCRWRVVFRPA